MAKSKDLSGPEKGSSKTKKKSGTKGSGSRESFTSRLAKRALRASLLPYRSIAFGYSTINLSLLRIFPNASGGTISRHKVAGISGEKHIPKKLVPGRSMLYFHGGGYTGGSAATHRSMVSRIAKACQTEIFVPDYRLAPRHPFPAALRDVQAIWLAMVRESPDADFFIGGDSAGGGLSTALLYQLRDQEQPMPLGAILLSPWMDVRMEHPGIELVQPFDPMLRASELRHYGEQYAAGHDLDDPLISPAEGDPHGLPQLLIQVGTADILFPDVERFARKALAAGNKAEFDTWPKMMHVWQATPFLPESIKAVHRMGVWMDRITSMKIKASQA